MNLCCISDTHSLHSQVEIPKCDYLLCGGDITGNGSLIHLNQFATWLKELKDKGTIRVNAIVIAGNHDECLESPLFKDVAKSMLEEFIYLEGNSCTLQNGMVVYGEPRTPLFMDWHFMCPREDMYEQVWSKVPENIDILLTHGAPYDILDFVHNTYQEDHHVGCKGLLKRMYELENLKYLICGHLHSGYGYKRYHKGWRNVDVYNVSTCNENYEPVNQPVVIEI